MTRSSKSALVAILSLAAVPWIILPDDTFGTYYTLWGVIYPDTTIWILQTYRVQTGVSSVQSLLLLSPFVFYLGAAVSAASGIFIRREDTRITVGLLSILGILPLILSIYEYIGSGPGIILLPTGAVAVGLVVWQFYRPVVPYLGGTSPPDVGSSSVQSSGSSTPVDDSKTTTSDSTTDDETTTNASDTKFSKEIQSDAEAARKEAESARANGDHKTAIEEYRGAINLYGVAIQELPAGEAELRDELTKAIESTRADLEKIKTRHEQQSTVIEALKPAERSLQEAIVAYIENDQTVARIRFRQARDTFEDAYETIMESESDLLTDPVTVEAQPDRKPSSITLADLPMISEAEATALADAGIETVDDLDRGEESPWRPAAVEGLVANESIEEDTATALALLSWWHGDESYTFETAEAVARRQQQADYGFDQSS